MKIIYGVSPSMNARGKALSKTIGLKDFEFPTISFFKSSGIIILKKVLLEYESVNDVKRESC